MPSDIDLKICIHIHIHIYIYIEECAYIYIYTYTYFSCRGMLADLKAALEVDSKILRRLDSSHDS